MAPRKNASTVTKEEMIALEKKLDKFIEQSNRVNGEQSTNIQQLIWLIKGSDSLTIEGVLPKLTKIENKVGEIDVWKDDVEFYLGIIASKKFWRVTLIILAIVAGVFVGIKYGWEVIARWIRAIFL